MSDGIKKASLLLRVIAKLIDFILIAIAVKIIPQIGLIAGIVYILISDGLFEGRSIGKKVLKLKTISLNTGNAATFRDSIIRNSTIAAAIIVSGIPLLGWLFVLIICTLEFLLMLGNKQGMRLGDDFANTYVIED